MRQNKNKVAFVDFDGTLIAGQSQFMLVWYMYGKKVIKLTFLLRLVFFFILYKLHVSNDVSKTMNFAISFSKNLPVDDFDALVKDFCTRSIFPKVRKSGTELIKSLRDDGYTVVLLSTAIEPMIRNIFEYVGADYYICTKINEINGKYTGTVNGNIVYGIEKMKSAVDFISRDSVQFPETVAYADHVSDFPLLKYVSKGYVVNPSKKLHLLASSNGLGVIELR